MNTFQTIQQRLASWYEQHYRSLPWRSTRDPYCIWISEVILQQTRVDQGMNYYLRFVERFPDVASLAAAEEHEVLKLWQGLGYYSRARNLHKAARQIMSEHNGKFPDDYDSIMQLSGIGPYTAAAIGSIAFDLPVAAVDGNVSRVVSRLFGVDEHINKNPGMRMIGQLADELLDHAHPSRHNQAMMEFGALHCVPANPKCEPCIFADLCEARSAGRVNELPLKYKSGKRRKRHFHYLIILHRDEVAVQQRGANDIWQGLYEFPLIEKDEEGALRAEDYESAGLRGGEIMRVNEIGKHVLSHQDIFARFYHLRSSHRPTGRKFVKAASLSELALPRLIDRYLEQYDLKTGEKNRL